MAVSICPESAPEISDIAIGMTMAIDAVGALLGAIDDRMEAVEASGVLPERCVPDMEKIYHFHRLAIRELDDLAKAATTIHNLDLSARGRLAA